MLWLISIQDYSESNTLEAVVQRCIDAVFDKAGLPIL